LFTGFHVGMTDGTGAYFVCDDAAGRERWVDALTLVRHVAARRSCGTKGGGVETLRTTSYFSEAS
jgi:hypothetical protein